MTRSVEHLESRSIHRETSREVQPIHDRVRDLNAVLYIRLGHEMAGAGYKQIASGPLMVSASSGCRMLTRSTRGIGSHVRFEMLDQAGTVLENLQLPVGKLSCALARTSVVSLEQRITMLPVSPHRQRR